MKRGFKYFIVMYFFQREIKYSSNALLSHCLQQGPFKYKPMRNDYRFIFPNPI